MSTSFFARTLTATLIVTLLAPSLVLIVPQKTYAQVGVPIVGVGPNEFTTAAKTTFMAIKETLIEISDATTAAAQVADNINTYVLQPLAFVLSGNLMKMLTSSVISFVIGKANGTGIPQFVVDVRKTMQTVSDGQALAYLKQVGLTKSPFAGSISSALNTDYLSKSSLAGFWARNMCTLEAVSPNVPAYLAGNWSQGGVAAWFALTTQTQNNPYTLYQNTQSQMGSQIGTGSGGATGVRTSELNWGQGFMSWCGATDPTSTGDAVAGGGSTVGVNPGDPCNNSDGTAGTIKTPGTVIKATLDKVLGGQQDEIVRMGNVGPQINSILGNIATVMKTVNFAASLLGGSSSGGLFGADGTSASSPTSGLASFTPTRTATGEFTTGYLGATNSAAAASASVTAANSVDKTTAVIPAATPVGAGGTVNASDMPTRVTEYQAAWGTIEVAAKAATSALTSLVSICTSYGNASQVAAAKSTQTSLVDPLFVKIAAVPGIAAAALAQNTLVQNGTAGTAAYNADLAKLQTMSPTYTETTNAKYDATSYGGASASPAGSLNVSGGSLVDQMNLIRTNADALQISACTLSTTGGGSR